MMFTGLLDGVLGTQYIVLTVRNTQFWATEFENTAD